MPVSHKGSISMGMVLIPIGLYKTTVDNDIHFNQLEKESKARIKYKKYCSHCGKEVGAQDIIRGYEYEKDKYGNYKSKYPDGDNHTIDQTRYSREKDMNFNTTRFGNTRIL